MLGRVVSDVVTCRAMPKTKEKTSVRYVRLTDKQWATIDALAKKEEGTAAHIIRRAVRLFLAGGDAALAKAEEAPRPPTDEDLAGSWVLDLDWESLREKRGAPRGLWFDGRRRER